MADQGFTNTSVETLPGLLVRQSRRLLRIMYLQALLLAVTYVMGVWLATVMAAQITVTEPEVVLHVTLACTFASITAALGFLAMLQRQRDVAVLNLLLFLAMVVAGVTGFALLGDLSSGAQVTMTNITMATVAGFGMPVTGYSMAKEARIVRSGRADVMVEPSAASALAMIALVALALTVVAGVSTMTIALSASLAALYATAVAIHFGLAAVTISLSLGVFVLAILEGPSNGTRPSKVTMQRALFGMFALAAASLAGGAGVIAAGLVPGAGGGLSYIVMMGETVSVVYGFLILVLASPFGGPRALEGDAASGAPRARAADGDGGSP